MVPSVQGALHAGRRWLLACAIGLAAFLWLGYGRTLDTGDLDWIWTDDPFAHAMGWEQYRNAPMLQYPIGQNEGYGLERSSSVVYSDSIPAVAVTLRPISPLLPRPFQYLGWWALVTMILQAYWGGRLIELRSDRLRDIAIGSAFFVISPVLLNRIGVHSALSSHWLLLSALWLYFSGGTARHAAWAGLLVLTVSIHAYLFVMVGMLWTAHLVSCHLRRTLVRRDAVAAAAIVVGVLAWMHALGYFVGGGGPRTGAQSRFDVTALITDGAFTTLLPVLPKVDWDSNAYLGVGVLGLLLASAVVLAARRGDSDRSAAVAPPVPWTPILVATGTLMVFALTHRLVFAGTVRVTLPMPSLLEPLYTAFRGSARMIWPAYYLIVLSILWLALRAWPRRTGWIAMTAALLVQVIDIRAGVALKASELHRGSVLTPLRDPVWSLIASRHRRIVSIPAFHGQPDRHTLAWFSARHGFGSNIGYFGRMDAARQRQGARTAEQAMLSGRYDPHTVYYFPYPQLWRIARHTAGPSDLAVVADGHHLIIPGGRDPHAAPDPPPPLAPVVDAWISFASGEPGRGLFLDGWSGWGDSWGTWTIAPEARLLLPVPPGESLRIEMSWLATALRGQVQEAQVWFDEQSFQVRFPEGTNGRLDSFDVTSRERWMLIRLIPRTQVMPTGGLGVGLKAVRVHRTGSTK